MTTYTRPVLLLLCGLFLTTLSIAVLNTLVPLWLAHDNLPTWEIGVDSSAYFMGNLVGALLAGDVIKRFGFNRSYYIASVIFAIAAVGLGLMIGFWSWGLWRFLAGIGCAMIWVVVESAMLCSGTVHTRGRLLAAYMMVYYGGTVLGQLMVTKLSTALMSVLPWVTALTLVAILPLLFAHIVNQQTEVDESHEKIHVLPMLTLRQARLGVEGCVISGVVLGSLYGLMPLWLSHQHISDSGIGFWMAVLVGAGIIGQWPVGRLADYYGRLFVLRIQVIVVILGCIAILTHASMALALFALGAAGFTLYPVAMAWACEKVEHHQLVAMNQALLLSYTVGCLVGPSLAAMLMQRYSDNSLFGMIACVSAVYLLMLFHKDGHHLTPVAHA